MSLIDMIVVVGVFEEINVWNAVGDYTIATRIQADGNIQAVGKRGDLVSSPVSVRVFEDLDGVATALSKGSGKRVFLGSADPQTAFAIEGHVHGLLQLGLRSE